MDNKTTNTPDTLPPPRGGISTHKDLVDAVLHDLIGKISNEALVLVSWAARYKGFGS